MQPKIIAWLDRLPDRLHVYIEPRDAWIGVFVSAKGITYVCPVPFLVIAWKRKKARGNDR